MWQEGTFCTEQYIELDRESVTGLDVLTEVSSFRQTCPEKNPASFVFSISWYVDGLGVSSCVPALLSTLSG